MAFKAGFTARAYVLTTGTRATWGTATNGFATGAAPASLTELTVVKDLTIPIDATGANVTTRGSGGWEITLPTLFKLAIDLEVMWDAADAGVAALMKAFLTRTVIPVALLDGDKAGSGVVGVWADYVVTKWEKGEQLAEGQTAKFTIAPGPSAVPPEVVKVT